MTTVNVTCPVCAYYDTVQMETGHLQKSGDEESVNFACQRESCDADFVVRITVRHEVDVTATVWTREKRP